jgi:hypothetical protein
MPSALTFDKHCSCVAAIFVAACGQSDIVKSPRGRGGTGAVASWRRIRDVGVSPKSVRSHPPAARVGPAFRMAKRATERQAGARLYSRDRRHHE